MRFAALYRISMYLLLFLSALILNIDADATIEMGGSFFRYTHFFPMAMALAGVLAFLTVDRHPGRGLSTGVANMLGLSSLLLVYIEYQLDRNQLVLACGHWLFYLTLVKMFRPKTPGDDWYLILLGLMQVLVGCFLSQGDRVGLLLLVWAVLALWVLSLFYLHRESLRSGADWQRSGPVRLPEDLDQDVGPSKEKGGGRGPRARFEPEPYPGLFGMPFYISTARAATMTLMLGVLIFLIMPRTEVRSQSNRGGAAPRSLTGFSEEVRLGQMGEILENDTVVFTAELSLGGRRYRPEPDELLWRGVTLVRYEDGRWRRDRGTIQLGTPPAVRRDLDQLLEQRIHLESTAERVIFALRPVLDISVRPDGLIALNSHDGTLIREPERGYRQRLRIGRNFPPLDYVVRSEAEPGDVVSQPGENDILTFFPDGGGLLDLPADLVEPLREISDRVVAGLPLEDVEGRARALERYLKESGEFSYTLQMLRVDPGLDPNLDFLLNTRRGHCEYFASALALLLRSQGIPCRIVNGFKGGDWTDLMQVHITVRQRHAHSWVEAYLGANGSNDRLPRWLTLDPAPSAEREEQVEMVSRWPRSFRQVVDLVRYLWVFYVAGFNPERQEQLLYQPIRTLISEARDGFRIMRIALMNVVRWLTEFPSPRAFFSIRGFIVSCLVMLLLVGLFQLGRKAWRMMSRRLGGEDDLAGDPSGVLAAYVRLVRILEHYGLQRPASETPREFARRASLMLGERLQDREGRPLTDVPSRVVEAFYRVRFGDLPLGPEAMAHLDAQLDELEFGLRPTPA